MATVTAFLKKHLRRNRALPWSELEHSWF